MPSRGEPQMPRMCIIYKRPALRFHLRSSKASSKRFEGGFEVARMYIIYIHPALRFHLRSSKASSKRFEGGFEVARMYIIYTHLALRFHSRSSKACFPAAHYLQDIPPEKQGGSEREPERGSAGLYSNLYSFASSAASSTTGNQLANWCLVVS